jgi:hypothetical protein
MMHKTNLRCKAALALPMVASCYDESNIDYGQFEDSDSDKKPPAGDGHY